MVTALVVLLTLIVGLLGLLVAGLLRSHGEILRALHDMGENLDPSRTTTRSAVDLSRKPNVAPGVPEPRDLDTGVFDVAGVDPYGNAVSAAVLGTGRLTLMGFLTSSCLACEVFWQAFTDPQIDVPGGARVVLLTKGPEAESESALRRLAPREVPTILSTEAWQSYGIPVAPYFVLIDGGSDRVIGEGAATSWAQVHNLMSQALADQGILVEGGRRVTSGERALAAHLNGREREARIDDELRAAGIEPGDPSLYGQVQPLDPSIDPTVDPTVDPTIDLTSSSADGATVTPANGAAVHPANGAGPAGRTA